MTLGRRVALVIGNSAYVNVPRLPNPTGDAEAIAQVLRADGFKSVTVVEDASRADMASGVQAFQAEADQADWALVYYAGHDIEIGGTNYLVPADARLKSDRNAPDEAMSLNRVIDTISGAKKLKLLMLDACRDNPFPWSGALPFVPWREGSPASSRRAARSWSTPPRTATWPKMGRPATAPPP
jgi:uncharacterized caspase-like protein